MRGHLPALDHGAHGPGTRPLHDPDQRAPRRHHAVRVPGMAPQHHGAHTVLTGLLDPSALYGVLAEIEALGLDLLELRKLTPDRESPETGHHRSP